eukprot:1158269-Pelagomonas_calceolata.AAC.11
MTSHRHSPSAVDTSYLVMGVVSRATSARSALRSPDRPLPANALCAAASTCIGILHTLTRMQVAIFFAHGHTSARQHAVCRCQHLHWYLTHIDAHASGHYFHMDPPLPANARYAASSTCLGNSHALMRRIVAIIFRHVDMPAVIVCTRNDMHA